MASIHPTTMAIMAGLRNEAPTDSPLQRGLTAEVCRLVAETKLRDAEDIASAGQNGWDLGFRNEGSRYELTARIRVECGYEVLITAMIDRRTTKGWSYVWLVQGENPANALPKELYPNSAAPTFDDAVTSAVARLQQKDP